MLGYIKKDFLILKKDSVFYIILILLFSIFKTLPGNFLSSLYCVAMTFNVFAYEEKNSTAGYLCALPNGRKNMVISKYVLFILISMFLITISTTVPIIVNIVNGQELLYNNSFNFIFVSAPMIIMSIVLPLIYLFGANRARIFLFIIFFGASFTMAYVSTIFPEIKEHFLFLQDKMYLIFVLSIIIYVISFFISLWINDRKDY